MPVLRNEPVSSCAQSPDARRAHHPRDEPVKRVPLNSHEFGETLMPAEQLSVAREINLFAGHRGREVEVGEVRYLPRDDVNGNCRSLLKMPRDTRAETTIPVKNERGYFVAVRHKPSQSRERHSNRETKLG